MYVDGQADGAATVCDPSLDGLTDPPRRVGRELEALAPVELLDRAQQAEVPFLDQVEQRDPRRAIPARDRNDQSQIRRHHADGCFFVALLDALRERYFVGRRAAGMVRDLLS